MCIRDRIRQASVLWNEAGKQVYFHHTGICQNSDWLAFLQPPVYIPMPVSYTHLVSAHTSCHLTSDSHTAPSGIIHLQIIESKIQSIIPPII